MEGAMPDVPLERVRKRKKRSGPRARTTSIRRLSKRDLDEGRELYPTPEGTERPATRRDCLPGGCNEERPCPFMGCRHHLALDVHEERGSIKENFPDVELEGMAETCSLDVADRGGVTLEQVGALMNLTRERVRQYEVHVAMVLRPELQEAAEDLGIDTSGEPRLDDDDETGDEGAGEPVEVIELPVLPKVDLGAQLAAARAAGAARGPAIGSAVNGNRQQLTTKWARAMGKKPADPGVLLVLEGEAHKRTAANSAHGTRARYVNAGCRCEDCREANRRYRRAHVRGVSVDQLDEVEAMAREATCLKSDGGCGGTFEAADRGMIPKRCPECKGKGASAPTPRQPRATKAREPSTSIERAEAAADRVDIEPLARTLQRVQLAPMFTVRLGRLEIEVHTREGLEMLVDRWGAQ
jgi:hypothetical protein